MKNEDELYWRLLLAGHGDGEESEEDIVRSVSKGGYYVGGDTATPVHSHSMGKLEEIQYSDKKFDLLKVEIGKKWSQDWYILRWQVLEKLREAFIKKNHFLIDIRQ